MDTKRFGNFGEKIAKDYLENKGYQILDKNYFFRIPGNPQRGEIDIIARKSDIISFVEVKTLRFLSSTQKKLFFPEEKVNFSKQRKLRITAESWLMKKKIPLNCKWQIDVIAVNFNSKTKKADISHFENAVSYQ